MPSPLNRPLLVLLLAASLSCACNARKARLNFDAAPADTIATDPHTLEYAASYAESVTLAGYSKTRDASRESLLASNSGTETVVRLVIEIDYRSMDGRQITKRTVEIPCVIPPGETRKLDFTTWDAQHVFYYHGSPSPRRAPASPYMVRACVRLAYCGRR